MELEINTLIKDFIISNSDVQLSNLKIVKFDSYTHIYNVYDISTNINYNLKVANLGNIDWIRNIKIANDNPDIFPIIHLAWIDNIRGISYGFSLQQMLHKDLYSLTENYPDCFLEPLLLDVLGKCIRINELNIDVNGFSSDWMLDVDTFKIKYVGYNYLPSTENRKFCKKCTKGNLPENYELQMLLSRLMIPEFLGLAMDILSKPNLDIKIIQCCNYLIKAIREDLTYDRVIYNWNFCVSKHQSGSLPQV